VPCELRGPADKLSASAKRSEDGKMLVVQVVNWDAAPRPVRIEVAGFSPTRPAAQVEQLAGPLDAVNTAEQPERITPKQFDWRHGMKDGAAQIMIPPHSFTILRFE